MERYTRHPATDEQTTSTPTIQRDSIIEGNSNIADASSLPNPSELPAAPNMHSAGIETGQTRPADSNTVEANTANDRTPQSLCQLPDENAAAIISDAITAAIDGQAVVDRATDDITVSHLLRTVADELVARDCTTATLTSMLRLVARLFSTQALADFRRWFETTSCYHLIYNSMENFVENPDKKNNVFAVRVRELANLIVSAGAVSCEETSGGRSHPPFARWILQRVELWKKHRSAARRVQRDPQALSQYGVRVETLDRDLLEVICSYTICAKPSSARFAQARRQIRSDLRAGASLTILWDVGGEGIWHMLYDQSIRRILETVPPDVIEATISTVRQVIPHLPDIYDPMIEYSALSSVLTFQLYNDDILLRTSTRREHTMLELMLPIARTTRRECAEYINDPSSAPVILYPYAPEALRNAVLESKSSVTTTTSRDGRRLAGGPGLTDQDLDFAVEDEGDSDNEISSSEQDVNDSNSVPCPRTGDEDGEGKYHRDDNVEMDNCGI